MFRIDAIRQRLDRCDERWPRYEEKPRDDDRRDELEHANPTRGRDAEQDTANRLELRSDLCKCRFQVARCESPNLERAFANERPALDGFEGRRNRQAAGNELLGE